MNSTNWGEIVLTILGSGSFSTVVTYLINRGFNNKKLHAEIISKARIDWINEFRSLSSSYLYEAYKTVGLGLEFWKYDDELNKLDENTEQFREIKEKYENTIEEYNKQAGKMIETYIQMRLYLPKRNGRPMQKEHKRIVGYIDLLHKNITSAVKNKELDKIKKIKSRRLRFLTDYISKYLKQEWDKAKAKE
ncbi:hypothetical protein PXW92_03705 [Staphylococcus hominis]|uniref:hypothetical protein n=1 Tax=Staphylococcus hominis TaxID=1290 RepID=UPI0012DD3690|nr:hypothetical protein [Staphylococcus hominis]MDS0980494.1 hypothetical protein [Staphylococcus hominis]QGR78532.1 hypothetical protein FOC54_00565 [Staphylococcus hominis]